MTPTPSSTRQCVPQIVNESFLFRNIDNLFQLDSGHGVQRGATNSDAALVGYFVTNSVRISLSVQMHLRTVTCTYSFPLFWHGQAQRASWSLFTRLFGHAISCTIRVHLDYEDFVASGRTSLLRYIFVSRIYRLIPRETTQIFRRISPFLRT